MKPIKFIDPLLECLKLDKEPNILQLSANCLLNLVDINADLAQAIG